MSVGVGLSLLRIHSARLPGMGSLCRRRTAANGRGHAQHAVLVVGQAEVARAVKPIFSKGMQELVVPHETLLRRIVDRHAPLIAAR